MYSKIGKRYKVVKDIRDKYPESFPKDTIVVAIDEDDVPYCVREEDYINKGESDDLRDYETDEYWAYEVDNQIVEVEDDEQC